MYSSTVSAYLSHMFHIVCKGLKYVLEDFKYILPIYFINFT